MAAGLIARDRRLSRKSLELSPAERALRERFEATYTTGQSPVMRAGERSVCGCDYGATGWTTVEEAHRIGALLALGPGVRLLDIGAGAGWPAHYLAKTSGCSVILTDLPISGLRIAAERAMLTARLSRGRLWVAVSVSGLEKRGLSAGLGMWFGVSILTLPIIFLVIWSGQFVVG